MLNGIGCSPSNAWAYRPGGCHSRQNATDASRLIAAAASRETDAEISITTAEGDTVTIGLHSEADVTYAGYRGQGRRADSLSVSTSQSIEITVEGDLSEQEKADVANLVKQLSQVVRGFLSGSPTATMDASGEGDVSTTIASFSLHVDQTRTVTVMASIGEPDSGSDAASEPSDTGDAPAIAAPAPEPVPMAYRTPVTDAPAEAATVDAKATPATPSISESVLDQLMNAVKESRMDLRRMGRALAHSLVHMLRHMERERGMERSRPALREIANRLPERLPVSLAPEDTATL